MQQSMTLDHWIGNSQEFIQVENPTWMQVEEAIRQLDQDKHTSMSLQLDDYTNFIVGGGKGRFIVGYDTYNSPTRPDEGFGLIELSNSKDERVEMVAGGQLCNVPAREVVNLKLALKAARFFFENQKPDPELSWSTT